MTNQNTLTYIYVMLIRILLLAALVFNIGVWFAHAQVTPIVALTINGGANTTIVNGQSILLEWYVVGTSNCSINNGVGPINTSASTTGSLIVIPPDNVSTDYILTCSTGSDIAEVEIRPDVLLSSPTGSYIDQNTRHATASALTGDVYVTLNWESEYATECSNISYVREGDPTIRYVNSHSSFFSDEGLTEGTFTSRWPNSDIRITTTYYITCTNAITGASETDALTIVVLAPPAPPALTLIATTTTPVIAQDVNLGVARANVRYTSQGASSCSFRAYTLSGTQYNVPGFSDMWGGHAARNVNVNIATSTRFDITCSRGAVGIYPATSTTASVVVMLENPSGNFLTAADLPVPTITTLSAVPDTAELDEITGRASTRLTYGTQHTTGCTARAYYASGVEYTLTNWSGSFAGSATQTVSIATTTSFSIQCTRSFDGATTSTQFVTVSAALPAEIVIPEPKAYMYANAIYYRANDMMRLKTSGSFVESNNTSAFLDSAGNRKTLRSSNSGATPPVSITFPFNPAIASTTGLFNIHLRYCDESDGSARYTLSTQNNGVVSTWVSDKGTIDNSSSICETTSFVTELIAENLELRSGELITLSCDPESGTAEQCQVDTMYFGMTDEITLRLSPNVSTVPIPLLWLSKHTNICPTNLARTASGNYSFAANTGTAHSVTRTIATTTTFSVQCGSTGNALTDTSAVKVNVLPSLALTAFVGVISGECKDPDSGLPRTSFPWETVGANDVCTPAVDLLAVSPVINQGAAEGDNVTGIYDNIQISNVIANAGPGEVPAGESISYQTIITLQDGTEIIGPVKYYLGGLGAPAFGVPVQTSPLVETFDAIPFGTHEICTLINVGPGSVFPESNLDTTNNTSCITVNLAVPEPDLSLSVDNQIVRRGQPVRILINIPVTYPLNCQVNGTALESSTNDVIINAHEIALPSVMNASLYQLSCIEPLTNSVFEKEVLVEVVPTFEES